MYKNIKQTEDPNCIKFALIKNCIHHNVKVTPQKCNKKLCYEERCFTKLAGCLFVFVVYIG